MQEAIAIPDRRNQLPAFVSVECGFPESAGGKVFQPGRGKIPFFHKRSSLFLYNAENCMKTQAVSSALEAHWAVECNSGNFLVHPKSLSMAKGFRIAKP